MQIITATIETILVQKENGWGIFRTNQGVAKGTIPWEPNEGQVVKLEGDFQTSTFNGQREFAFKVALPALPADSRSLLAYAVSITNGLGPKKEQEIWDAHGEKWQQAIPLKMKGVSESTEWHWADALDRLESEKLQGETFAWLLAKGASMNMANAAWKRWEDSTYGKVEADCYALADLPHYGFQDVDRGIRKNFGIGDDDPRRIDAAILYVLRNRITDGSTFVCWTRLAEELEAVLGSTQGEIEPSLDRLIEAEAIEKNTGSNGEVGFSVKEDAENERTIYERFKF